MRRSYWTLNLDCKAEAVDKKGTLDRAHFLVKQAVKRQMDDDLPKVLSLSGGLDSRTILGAASQLGFELDTFTFGTAACPDQELARASADCVGMENRFLEISPTFLITWAEHGVWLTEGMDSCTNFHGIEFAPEIRKRASVVLNGFMGGELFGFLSFTAARLLLAGHSKGWIERLFTSMRHPFSQSELKVLLTERFYSKTKDYPFESFASLVGSAPSDSPFDKFYYFRFRELAPKSFLYGLLLDNDQMEYRVPFADYDLVDFVSRLPAKEKALASFHRRLLAEKFPPLGRIRYQRTGLPASSGTTRLLLRKTKDKIVKLAPKTRTYTNYGKWMRHEVKDFVIGTLLNDRSLGRGYFKPESVRGLIERDVVGRDRWAAQVGCLLTLELWSQLFMD